MSYSSPLPPTVTPGWNDPPMNLGPKSNGTGILAQKYRRPVDPSIQVTNQQDVMDLTAKNTDPELVNGLARPHSATTFQPVRGSANFTRTISEELHSHHSVYDSFTVPSGSSQQNLSHNRPNSYNYATEEKSQSAAPLHMNFTSGPDHYSEQTPKLPLMNVLPPTAIMPIEANPTALVYTPPNTVNEDFQQANLLSHPSNFVPPTKAAGDVSLDGKKLVEFLYKATMRLPAGVTRDGIQLRIGHLDQVAASGALSEPCIKKLNFIVDALDRQSYEEASQFFDQFQTAFPEESRTSWAQGIRLLLQESLQCFRRPCTSFLR